MDIEKIYNEYIEKKNETNRIERYVGHEAKFQASNAGWCIKKHYFGILGFGRDETRDMRTNRLLQLGNIVHADIQEAFKDIDGIIIEHEINIPEYNVRGFFDIADIKTLPVQLIDIKTTAAYKWQKMFGRDYNRDKNPFNSYELQIATYAIGLSKEMDIDPYDDVRCAIVYYKKDNSDIKWIDISSHYIDLAMDYWEEVNSWKEEVTKENINEVFIPGRSLNVPTQQWQCNYCDFAKHCNSPFIKTK